MKWMAGDIGDTSMHMLMYAHMCVHVHSCHVGLLRWLYIYTNMCGTSPWRHYLIGYCYITWCMVGDIGMHICTCTSVCSWVHMYIYISACMHMHVYMSRCSFIPWLLGDITLTSSFAQTELCYKMGGKWHRDAYMHMFICAYTSAHAYVYDHACTTVFRWMGIYSPSG